MSDLDLTPFCVTEPAFSYQIQAPWSRGLHTFATDGHIMVRVPRRPDVPEGEDTPPMTRTWPAEWPSEMRRLQAVTLPSPPRDTRDCGECHGRGTAHDCPACACQCDARGGTGFMEAVVEPVPVGIGTTTIDLRYARMLLALPGIAVESEPKNGAAIRFQFEGGEGLLMPLRADMEAVALLEFAS